MQTFVVKLASGVAALIASICLSICNLSNNTEALQAAETAASSVFGLRMTMTVFPIIGLLIALAVFGKKFILTEKKVEEITQQLRKNRVSE